MLAEAVRNTQPQPVGNAQPSLSTTHNTSGSVRRNRTKNVASVAADGQKLKPFGHLLIASRGVDNAVEDPMIDKMTKNPAQRPEEKAFLQAQKRRPATEYERAQEAFQKNYERLRAERLAREAAKPKQK